MLVELGLGGRQSGVEVAVIEGRVYDLVAVLNEVGRFDPTGDRMPAVEEEDGGNGSSCYRSTPAGGNFVIPRPPDFLESSFAVLNGLPRNIARSSSITLTTG